MASNMEGRTRVLTAKGKAYAMETLKKEMKNKRKKLSNQLSLLDDLLKTRNIEMVKTELNNLESLFTALKSSVDGLLDLVKKEEREGLVSMMSEEQARVVEAGNKVEEWLVAEGTRDSGSCQEDVKSTMQLTLELMLVQSRLEQKLSVCNQILGSDSSQMVDMELKELETISREMRETSNHLGEVVSDGEKTKVADIIDEAERKVDEIRKQVERRATRNNDSKVSELECKNPQTSGISMGFEIDVPKDKVSLSVSVKSLEQEDGRSIKSSGSRRSMPLTFKNMLESGLGDVGGEPPGNKAKSLIEYPVDEREDGKAERWNGVSKEKIMLDDDNIQECGTVDLIQGKISTECSKGISRDAQRCTDSLNKAWDKEDWRSGRSNTSKLSELIANQVVIKPASMKSFGSKRSNGSRKSIVEVKKPSSVKSACSRQSVLSTKSR